MMIRNIKSPIMMNGTRAIISYLGRHIMKKISSREFKEGHFTMYKICFIKSTILFRLHDYNFH